MARLSIALFGPLQVCLDGEPVRFESDKGRALLAYLVVESEGSHRREKLAGLLWPGWTEPSARNNLRHTLAVLRKSIGDREASPPVLNVTHQTAQFNTESDAWADVTAFAQLLQAAKSPDGQTIQRWEKAVDLYQGDLLQDFSLPDSPEFEEWALLSREQFRRQVMDTLHRMAEALGERGEYERALKHAWRQTELDPWREEAHLQVMRLLALSGRRSEALAQYRTCCRLLAEELGVEPAEGTTRLYKEIRDGKYKSPAPIAASPTPAAPPPFLAGQPDRAERPIFVARERELARLDGCLDLALAGQGRVVFVTGEAGSGKTALVQDFAHRAQQAHAEIVVASGNCNAHTGMGDPYLPFREVMSLLTGDVEAQWAAGAMTGEHARRLWNTLPRTARALAEVGPDLIDTFVPGPALVRRAAGFGPGAAEWLEPLKRTARPDAAGPVVASPQQNDLFEQYTRVLQEIARQAPLVIAIDDLQWADLGSISLLFHLGRHLAGSRILILGAYRPVEVGLGRQGQRHPLEPVVNEFQRLFGDEAVNVGQAEGRVFVEALLDNEPNRLAAAYREMLYQQTRGHPLFTIELLHGMQERGDLVRDEAGRWTEGTALDWETLPARVEGAIAERIARLDEPLQAVLRVASVEGEVFTAEVMARVLETDQRHMVQHLSSELDRRHHLVRAQAIERLGPAPSPAKGSQRLSRYRFRHILAQKYLYDSLDPVERAYLHEDVGAALEALYEGQGPGIVAVAPQLARHYQEAGLSEKAIPYLHMAGQRASQLSAYQEALAYLSSGLALFLELPAPGSQGQRRERAQQELDLQLALGMTWMGSKGCPAPQVKETFTRAQELCQELGRTAELSRVLGELSMYYFVRSEHENARELGEQALSLARRAGDPLLEALGHWFLGVVLFALGEYTAALEHFEPVLAFYDPQQHHLTFVHLRGSDPGLSALAYQACCTWCLGYPDRALAFSQEALALADRL